MMDTLKLLIIIVGALNFAQATVSDNTRTLPYYSGTFTSITCSTTMPSFLINGLYAPLQYDQLPGLFGIEAVVASDRSNVTLHVNGSTQLAHNVTVECRNIIDAVTGDSESMFHLTLQFVDAIPAPCNVQYSANDGVLRWSPPSIEPALENSNISIAFGITHYNIYVTDERNGLLIVNFTATELETSIAATVAEVPCSVSIQVSAVNPAGEGQRSRSITENQCSPDSVTLPQDSTTQEMDIENFNSSETVAFSFGEMVAVVIAGLFVVITMACIALLIVLWVFTKNRRALKSTKCNNVIHEDPEQNGQSRSSSEVSDTIDTTESSQTELLTLSSAGSPMVTPKQVPTAQHQVQSLDDNEKDMTNNINTRKHCTQDGQLIYAELATPVKINVVPQPSSVEDTAYAVIINHTDQTN